MPERLSLSQPQYRIIVESNYTIDLWSTSMVLHPGHRLRVDIASANFPRFDRNPNTAHPLFSDAEMQAATQTVFHDAGRPSHIVLPVISW